jgi:hypothetical protein
VPEDALEDAELRARVVLLLLRADGQPAADDRVERQRGRENDE